ncbi:hypothetical protein GEM_3336 [Burkholderia cepacia GG4]|uniref:Uncharacterized protein n=1 Tax=Burkholderia cepacia GG4 TaxID=1009846 RepID=A0A9W3K3S3_BURCE|nr:hypothetical protein GEM_3336 [Burkholderia cepacia GG4]
MTRLSEGLAGLPFTCFSPDAGATRVACLRHHIASSL